MRNLSRFTLAYLECALWSSTDLDGFPLDDIYGIEDLALEAIEQAKQECAAFQRDNAELLEGIDDELAGHDFWLTRNHHGTGFWDRGHPKAVGDALTEASHKAGERSIIVSDDCWLRFA